MNPPLPYFGEIVAVLTALTWAFAVILFKKSGETVHPVALNFFKNILASVLLVTTTFLAGIEMIQPCPPRDYILLFLSGAIGIGIADSMTFKALNILSGSVYAIVDCLYSPIVIGLSILVLGESLGVIQVIGVLFIVAAVFTSTREKSDEPLARKRLFGEILFFTGDDVNGLSFNRMGRIMASFSDLESDRPRAYIFTFLHAFLHSLLFSYSTPDDDRYWAR